MKRLVPALVAGCPTTTKTTAKSAVRKATRARNPQTVGASIIQGLKEAIAWTKGENDNVR